MNKRILTLLLILPAAAIVAQPVSKKGELYLPEAGDFSIGIDAVPILEYLGNFFNQNGNTAPSAEFTNSNLALTGKYFLRHDFAYRASARLGIFSETQKNYVPQFSTEPTNTTVEDSYSRNFNNIFASFGIEKRKGNTRIQGLYGAEGLLGFGTEKHKFEYGNAITSQNTNPTRTEWTVDFQNSSEVISTIDPQGAFMTEYKLGNTFKIGARAFIGAEFFFAPKWSIGFEYGYSLVFAVTGNSTEIYEQWTVPVGGSTEQFVTTVRDQGGSSVFRMDTDNSGGALFLNFFF